MSHRAFLLLHQVTYSVPNQLSFPARSHPILQAVYQPEPGLYPLVHPRLLRRQMGRPVSHRVHLRPYQARHLVEHLRLSRVPHPVYFQLLYRLVSRRAHRQVTLLLPRVYHHLRNHPPMSVPFSLVEAVSSRSYQSFAELVIAVSYFKWVQKMSYLPMDLPITHLIFLSTFLIKEYRSRCDALKAGFRSSDCTSASIFADPYSSGYGGFRAEPDSPRDKYSTALPVLGYGGFRANP